MKVTRELVEEIAGPPLLAILSTVNPEGSPRAMPVFYEYNGHTFNMTSYANLFKVRNIRRHPEVCLVIVDTVNYGDTLTVTGRAELSEKGVYEMTQKLNVRYLGEERGRINRERFLQAPPRIVIRVTPERMHYRRSMESPPRPSSTQVGLADG